MKKLIFTLALLISFFSKNHAQSDRFKAGIFAGVNFAQIDGDRQAGYNKIMPAVGLRGSVILSRRFDMGTELMYNGRGARHVGTFNANTPTANIQLSYADVLLTANRHYHLTEAGYFRSTMTIGLSYGRLLRATSEAYFDKKTDAALTAKISQSQLKSSDLGFMAAWAYRFTPKFGVQIRHTLSLLPIYSNPEFRTLLSKGLAASEFERFYSYYLSVNVFYDVISPKMKKKKAIKSKD